MRPRALYVARAERVSSRGSRERDQVVVVGIGCHALDVLGIRDQDRFRRRGVGVGAGVAFGHDRMELGSRQDLLELGQQLGRDDEVEFAAR